jgi:hypothetical protein
MFVQATEGNFWIWHTNSRCENSWELLSPLFPLCWYVHRSEISLALELGYFNSIQVKHWSVVRDVWAPKYFVVNYNQLWSTILMSVVQGCPTHILIHECCAGLSNSYPYPWVLCRVVDCFSDIYSIAAFVQAFEAGSLRLSKQGTQYVSLMFLTAIDPRHSPMEGGCRFIYKIFWFIPQLSHWRQTM